MVHLLAFYLQCTCILVGASSGADGISHTCDNVVFAERFHSHFCQQHVPLLFLRIPFPCSGVSVSLTELLTALGKMW